VADLCGGFYCGLVFVFATRPMKTVVEYLRREFWWWVLCGGVAYALLGAFAPDAGASAYAQSTAVNIDGSLQFTVSDVSSGGTSGRIGVVGFDNSTYMWNVYLVLTEDDGLVPGAAPSYTPKYDGAGAQGATWGGTMGVNNVAIAQGGEGQYLVKQYAPGTAYTFSVSNTNKTYYETWTVPPAPAVTKQCQSSDTNTNTVPEVFQYTDATTGQVLYSYVLQPGQSGTVTLTSNGHDVNEYMYLSHDPAGLTADASFNWVSLGSGFGFFQLVSGDSASGAVQQFVGSFAFNAMDAVNAAGTNPTTPPNDMAPAGGGGGQIFFSSAFPSGILVSQFNPLVSGTIINGTGGNGPVVFGPGAAAGQTGNTSALTQGVYAQGVNGITQVIGGDISGNEVITSQGLLNIVSGLKVMQGIISQGNVQIISGLASLGSGMGGGGGGGGSSFPSSIAVNNFPGNQQIYGVVSVSNFPGVTGIVSISNFPSGFGIPSSIAVNNWPTGFNINNLPSSFGGGTFVVSSVTVSNFPSAFAISNFPSGFAFPSGVSVSNMISTTAIESLLSSGNGTLYAISNGVSGSNVYLSSLASGVSAQNQYYNTVNSLASATPSTASMTGGGGAAGAVESGAVPAVSSPVVVDDLGAAPAFAIVMPDKFGGKTIDFNMFGSGPLGGVLSGFRSALSWLALMYYGVYCWRGLRVYITSAVNARQASGNPVLGGTGAQGTALIAAGLISVALMVGLVAFFALLGDVGFGSVSSLFGSGPFVGFVAGSLWMLNQVFPVSVIVCTMLGRMVFDALAIKIFLGVTAAVRYIVP
jgi:hypothetical protein